MGGPGSGPRKRIGPKMSQVMPPCGTSAMYQRHRKNGEDCTICRRANTKVSQDRQIRKGIARQLNSKNNGKKMRQMVIDEKLKRSVCMDCLLVVTLDNRYIFDFDHRDPLEKLFSISSMYKGVSCESLMREMDKCDLVCSNCHRHRTQKQFRTKVLTGFAMRPEVKQPTLFDREDICLPYS